MTQTMANERQPSHAPIVPREHLNFDLKGDIPKYWMANDPFKTRFFDAMSTLFPVGEKFFIVSVRAFQKEITDPQLVDDVRNFIKQEAQHTLVHMQYNERLKAQGIDVDMIEKEDGDFLFNQLPKISSAKQRLAATAAMEHLTSMMCTCFFERKDLLEASDPRMRAVYAWHAIEEVEHKAVAFDVLTKVAKMGWLRRNLSMLIITFGFPIRVAQIMDYMLRCDGFSLRQRAGMWAKGLWWFYKPGGLFLPTLGYYFAYYKPGFHPWKTKEMPSYGKWLEVYDATGDPIKAGNALHAAGQ